MEFKPFEPKFFFHFFQLKENISNNQTTRVAHDDMIEHVLNWTLLEMCSSKNKRTHVQR